MVRHPTVLGLVFAVNLIACSGGRVNYLPRDNRMRYTETDHVEVLFREPERSFIEIGLVTVESGSWSEEAMLRKLRDRAERAGADAVLVRSPTRQPAGSTLASWFDGKVGDVPATVRRIEGLAIRWK